MKELRLFGMKGTRTFALQVAQHLDTELSLHTEDYFADNECYVHSDVNVRGYDVFVIQSLHTSPKENIADRFAKLLFLIGSLRDASAGRITAVIPYFGYSRQDRKTESRVGVVTKYVAQLLESVGTDRVLTLDIHSLQALQNGFRVPTDNLEAKNLLADWTAENAENPDKLVILSPDAGGMGRAERFRKALMKRLNVNVGLAYLDKRHETKPDPTSGKVIQAANIIGNVKGCDVVVVDDMISSGATLGEANAFVAAAGGRIWAAEATHALFVGKVNENLIPLNQVVVTDSIDSERVLPELRKKLRILSTTRLFAQAIRRIHEEGGSISDLLK
jgi:ribose-phosphate pyrophosphokinase